ncbi:hypothetical protein [Roseateles chitosanitabidus]|jgi:hypothetical protein|uniref:hypothetical protein n=1 Tax=Roseateles chitosanitabidus TaxID=65048 RepID=UPI00082ACFE0|nr:hypothetical protein [Roseateles chitosanitabidus]MBO9685757.1 hypothetical protein [Roseateles chitosanitabidus]
MAQFTTPRPRQALALRKPRNPFVALSHQRSAGRHGPDGGARRQQEHLALKRELQRHDDFSP